MPSARLRFACLWLSQTARVLADWSLRIFVVLELARAGSAGGQSAWHITTAVFFAPFLLLAPFNGALCNSLPRRWVLVGSAAFVLVDVGVFGSLGGPWILCLTLAAAGSALYSPTRYALLPAAATDGRLPLSRVSAWIEAGGAAGLVAGIALAWELHDPSSEHGVWPPAVLACALANLVCLAAALPVRFPADLSRGEPPGQAVRGFFRDCRRCLALPEAAGSLLGLAGLYALLTAGAGAILSMRLGADFSQADPGALRGLGAVMVGVVAGSVLAGLQAHPSRGLGLVPLALTGLPVGLLWALAAKDPAGPSLLLGLAGGIATVPLRAYYLGVVPSDARGNATAVMNFVLYATITCLALLLVVLTRSSLLGSASAQLGFLLVLSLLGLGAAWYFLLRNVLEQCLEFLVWPIYRIDAVGPGLEQFPRRGPVLVLANHASWMDPLWVGKVVPRPFTPMMTATFFDKPVLRWLMTRVVHAIRVPESRFRREAPELDDAIKVLDREGVLLVFPEGMMRRKDEKLLARPFGQGVWRILKERPATPVVPFWIEGGWGSFMSYKGGPPTVNKRMDWWRPIRIGVGPVQVVDAALLEDQRATRTHLMQACIECRHYLGLEVPPPDGPSEEEKEPASEGPEPES